MIKNKNAFTLAELLVAMFIFAMIAVTLIPNVTQTAEKNLFITQVKKVYNDVQQAMLLLISKNNGTLMTLCSGDSANICFIDSIVGKAGSVATGAKGIRGYLEKRVTYAHDSANCENNELKDPCRQSAAFKKKKPQYMNKSAANDFDTHDADNFYASNLMNGATISAVFNAACDGTGIDGLDIPAGDICGYMEIDVNASKAPNMVGKDIHYFWISANDGLVPFGEIDNFECKNIKKNKDNMDQLGCTASIIQKGKIEHY